MTTLLIGGAEVVATMDDARTEVAGGSILIRDGAIEWERLGVRPIRLLEDLEFLGQDVWLAHCVHLSDEDVGQLAETGTGVAHCPSSNLRFGSGIAPVRRLLDGGAPVGLGVDGSASNDSNDLLAEVRQAMLVARAGGDPAALSAREALRIATRGGAACLGRDEEIGSLEPGKRADVALFDVTGWRSPAQRPTRSRPSRSARRGGSGTCSWRAGAWSRTAG